MKTKAFMGAVAMTATLLLALPAMAASLPTETFAGFNVGTPLDTTGTGWSYTGGLTYDVGIEANGIGGGNSLRISNGTMSGSFGDWVFSPAIAPATEGGSQKFTAEFDIKSVTGDNQGMSMNIAPQTAGGARMTNLRFEDRADGIHVLFSDVLNPAGTVGFQNAPFRLVDIATLSYGGTHNVKIVMNLIPGPSNDVVQVYIDGSAGLVPGRPGATTFDGFFAPVDNQPTVNKAKAGQTIPLKWRLFAPSFATSWEDYYRFDKESNGGSATPNPVDTVNGYGTRQVDSLIIQARGSGGNAQAQGKGYLIDNVTYESTALGTPLPVASQGVSDPSVYNNPPIQAKVETCGADDELDAIEVYASNNVVGLMYHGNGVWQYNWQTPKSLSGKCVEVKLSPLSLNGQTDFFFTK